MLQWKLFAVDLARRAGVLLKEKFNQKHEIHYKGEINLVTEADKMSEDLIIAAISRKFPDHGILSEESPVITGVGETALDNRSPGWDNKLCSRVSCFLCFHCLGK